MLIERQVSCYQCKQKMTSLRGDGLLSENDITWGQCYKTNNAEIYCHLRLNYHGIFISLNLAWAGSKLQWYFNPRKCRGKITGVNYRTLWT